MTEKRREATAVAAIVTRITSRSRPLVLRPVSPLKKELPTVAAMVAVYTGVGIGKDTYQLVSLSFTHRACASMSRAPT
jgi:hypothetical protein